jgi:hypothetical protein
MLGKLLVIRPFHLHSCLEYLTMCHSPAPYCTQIGVTIRFDSYKDAEEQMLHVLEVEANSPAELAGLVPFKDYLLGTAEKVRISSLYLCFFFICTHALAVYLI